MPPANSRLAFTIIETIWGIVIVAVVLGIALAIFGRAGIQTLVSGKFTVAPASVRQAPNTGTFTYTITRQIGTAAPVGIDNRNTKFEVLPAAGVTILTLSNANTTVAVNGPSGSLKTDAFGQVTVVVQVDYQGSDAHIRATDTTSGDTETVRFNCVP